MRQLSTRLKGVRGLLRGLGGKSKVPHDPLTKKKQKALLSKQIALLLQEFLLLQCSFFFDTKEKRTKKRKCRLVQAQSSNKEPL